MYRRNALRGLNVNFLYAWSCYGLPFIGIAGSTRIIAYILRIVERNMLNRLRGNLFCKLFPGPSEPQRCPDIPGAFFQCQVGVQDNQILCPAQHHRLGHDAWGAFIFTVKFPHPTHIARREAGSVGIRALQMFRHGHGSALFRPFADYATDFPVQLHLRQRGAHSAVYGREQLTVVDGLSDVHTVLLPALRAVIFILEIGRIGMI